jgi:hypothetical protein
MSITAYQNAVGNNPSTLSTDVARLIALSYQPFGLAYTNGGQLVQPMVKGTQDFNNNASASASVANGATVVVHNSAGSNVAGTHTAEVTSNTLNDVKLAATVAPIVNGGTSTVAPTGTFTSTVTFTVAAGVITAIALS